MVEGLIITHRNWGPF